MRECNYRPSGYWGRVVLPNIAEQLFAGYHFPFVLKKISEQSKLPCVCPDGDAIAQQFVTREIYVDNPKRRFECLRFATVEGCFDEELQEVDFHPAHLGVRESFGACVRRLWLPVRGRTLRAHISVTS